MILKVKIKECKRLRKHLSRQSEVKAQSCARFSLYQEGQNTKLPRSLLSSAQSSDNHIVCGVAGNWAAIDGRIFDLALVVALVDLEVSMITTILIPAVGNQPIVRSILHTPAHDLDCMPAKHWVSDGVASLVDAGLVGLEALVNEEHASDWTILVNILHHEVDAISVCAALRAHTVAGLAMFLAFAPCCPIVNALGG